MSNMSYTVASYIDKQHNLLPLNSIITTECECNINLCFGALIKLCNCCLPIEMLIGNRRKASLYQEWHTACHWRVAWKVSVHSRTLSNHVHQPAVDNSSVRWLQYGGGKQCVLPGQHQGRSAGTQCGFRSGNASWIWFWQPKGCWRRWNGWCCHRLSRRHEGNVVSFQPFCIHPALYYCIINIHIRCFRCEALILKWKTIKIFITSPPSGSVRVFSARGQK